MDESQLLRKIAENAAVGAAGSGIGAYLSKVTGVDRIVSFLGGFICSYLFTPVAVDYLNVAKYENPTSFVIGLLSMLFVKKVYEGFNSIDTKELAAAFVAKVRLWLGVK